MTLRERVFRGVVWSAGLSVATQVANFTMTFLLARVLGKEVFGEWGMVQNTIGAMAGVAQLAAGVTATKFTAELRHRDPARVGVILGLCSVVTWSTGAVASLALLIVSSSVATDVLHAPQLTFAVRVSIGYLFFLTINGYQVGALTGLEAFRPLAAVGAVYGACTTLLVVLLAARWGRDAALLGMSSAAFANWLVHRQLLRRYCHERGIRITYRGLAGEARVLIDFSVPASLAGLAGSLGVWLSNVIVVRHERGYEHMAVLSAGQSFRSLVLFAPTVIARVSMPVLVNLSGNQDRGAYRRAYARSLWVLSGAAVAMAVPIALLAPRLLLVFGRNYVDGAPVVAIFAMSTVFEVIEVAFFQRIYAAGRMWWGFSVAALRASLRVTCAMMLVPILGATGAAIANAVAYGGSLVLTYTLVHTRLSDLLDQSARDPGVAPR